MKYLIYLCLIIVIFSVDVGVFAQFKFFGAAPNLLLLLIIFISTDKSAGEDFLFFAFFSGLLLDAYSGLLIGTFSLPFVVTALLLERFTEKVIVYELSWKYALLLVVFATLSVHILVWSYSLATKTFGWFPYSVSWQVTERLFLPELIYNIFLLYPMYQLMQWVKRLIGKVEIRRHRLV